MTSVQKLTLEGNVHFPSSETFSLGEKSEILMANAELPPSPQSQSIKNEPLSQIGSEASQVDKEYCTNKINELRDLTDELEHTIAASYPSHGITEDSGLRAYVKKLNENIRYLQQHIEDECSDHFKSNPQLKQRFTNISEEIEYIRNQNSHIITDFNIRKAASNAVVTFAGAITTLLAGLWELKKLSFKTS